MKLAYQKMSVMLVDSLGMITGTLNNLLQPLGFYRIYTVKSAEEALNLIAEGKEINLIISMWKLKAMSGPQLVESLRQRYKELPILLIVDMPDKTIKDKARQVGVTALLQQPLDSRVATKAIEDALAPFINEDEENFAVHMNNARQAARRENYVEAISEYRAALAIKEDDDAWFGLAESLRQQGGAAKEAEPMYMALLRRQPSVLRGYLGLANLYYANNRPEDALKVLTHALALAQRAQEDGDVQADILAQMGEVELMMQRIQPAIAYFDQAVEASPQNTQIIVRAADALVHVGKLEESERFYQQALTQNPNLAHVYNRLGIAYRQQKKFDQALDLYTKALEHSPNDENLLYNMARSLWEMEDLAGAADILSQALKINPQFIEALHLLNVIKKGLKPGRGAETA